MKKRGFSLVELLVVIAIIPILAGNVSSSRRYHLDLTYREYPHAADSNDSDWCKLWD